MKAGSVLVNVGRGPTACTDALLAALQSGHRRTPDAFEQEPTARRSPIVGSTQRRAVRPYGRISSAGAALGQQFVDNFQRWQQGEALANPVSKEHGYVSTIRIHSDQAYVTPGGTPMSKELLTMSAQALKAAHQTGALPLWKCSSLLDHIESDQARPPVHRPRHHPAMGP